MDIPSALPAVTPKSAAINGHHLRFTDTPQHEYLHSNIIPEIMSYTRHPFPDTLSDRLVDKYGPESPFREREIIREWVEDIFVRAGNDKLVELSTTVERAEKIHGKWVLTLRKEGSGKNHWWQESFDALVVASGHYNIPWIPDIPGLREYDEKYPGRLLHSKHFRDATRFEGKVSCPRPSLAVKLGSPTDL